jgi:hypothetical protein
MTIGLSCYSDTERGPDFFIFWISSRVSSTQVNILNDKIILA